MLLKEHIDDIRNNLENNMYPDETSVSDNVVRRLIHRGWGGQNIHLALWFVNILWKEEK